MINQTFLPNEVEQKISEGWQIVKENIFGGAVRSVTMQREGNATAWVDEHAKNFNNAIVSMGRNQRRMLLDSDRLRRRGYDL